MRCCASPRARYVVEDDRRRLSREHYFKTAEQMAELFADLPEALANTIEIAKRCAFRPKGRKPILPRFVSRRAGASEEELLAARDRGAARARPRPGLEARLAASAAGAGLHARGLREAARLRARRHLQDEVPRLLPDRRRLHQVGQGQRHPGRAGPRLGRRLGRRLVAHHHRSRSAALRPAVRALPQSRARVDAGLRHRLLPGPPRRGDPLRAEASTAPTASRRSSRTASCRRAPCCATSAACCRCPTARSTSCASWCPTIRPIR